MVEEFWVVDANKDFLAGDSYVLKLALLNNDDDGLVWVKNGDFEFIVFLDENNWLLFLLSNDVFCIEFR